MTAVSEPVSTPQLGFWRLTAINFYKFGGDGVHWAPISFVLLPVGAALVAGEQAALLIGRVTASGAVFAVIVPVIVGYLSDRTAGRYGRRRPWMVAGTVLNVAGLLLLASAGSVAALVAAFLVVQISNNGAFAAYAAVIPDTVPAEQNGRASGLLNGMQQLGTVVGLVLIQLLLSALGSTRQGLFAGYSVIALVGAGSLLVALAAIPERPIARVRRAARGPVGRRLPVIGAALLAGLVALEVVLLAPVGPITALVAAIGAVAAVVVVAVGAGVPALQAVVAPLRDRDFFWVITTRFFNTFGIYSIAPFITLYFRDVVGSRNFGAAGALWLLALIAGGVLPAIFGGMLSDRLRRRKLFVYLSSVVQVGVSAVLIFSLVSSQPLLYVLGVVFGFGFGAYQAVDWALACDLLPDRDRAAAKDMALFHVSFTLPQVLGPALFGGILYRLNQPGSLAGITTGSNLGYRIVFASAAVWFVLSTVFVSRIRGTS